MFAIISSIIGFIVFVISMLLLMFPFYIVGTLVKSYNDKRLGSLQTVWLGVKTVYYFFKTKFGINPSSAIIIAITFPFYIGYTWIKKLFERKTNR